MKKILLGFLFTILSLNIYAQKQPQGVTYEAQILRVSDGDTIVISAPYLPAPLKPQLSVRIFGVDTPEKGNRAQCSREAQLGEMATQFTKRMISQGRQFHVTLYGWDKFGGRVLGTFIIDGVDLRTELIRNGLAIPYYGEKKTHDWCK